MANEIAPEFGLSRLQLERALAQAVADKRLAEADRDELIAAMRSLHSEVDCRIQHGAASGGHLEYVRDRLAHELGCGSWA